MDGQQHVRVVGTLGAPPHVHDAAQQGLGLRRLALVLQQGRQVVHEIEAGDVVVAPGMAAGCQALKIQPLRLRRPASDLKEQGQIGLRGERIGMARAEYPALGFKRLAQGFFGLGRLPLPFEQPGKVAGRFHGPGVLRPEHARPGLQGPAQEGLGIGQLVLVQVHRSQVAHGRQRSRVLFSQETTLGYQTLR